MIALTIVLAIVGLLVGGGAAFTYTRRTQGKSAEEAKKKLAKAKKEAEETIRKANEEADRRVEEARKDEKSRREEIKKLEQKLLERQEALDKKLDELDNRSQGVRKSEEEDEALKNEIRDIRKKQQDKLEKIAK